jgi:hypothetical protein
VVCLANYYKSLFKQWWSTVPPISTKQTATSHLKSLKAKNTIHVMQMDLNMLGFHRDVK